MTNIIDVKSSMPTSDGVTNSLFDRAVISFGKNVLQSRGVSAAVSAVFGAFIAAAETSPTGLFAAATAFVLTENFRMMIKEKTFHEKERNHNTLMLQASAEIDQIPLLKNHISSLNEIIQAQTEQIDQLKNK